MTTRTFWAYLSGLIISVFFIPQLEELIKMYVISVVVLITVIINLLFRFQRVREWVVNQITADVIRQVLQDADVRKLLGMADKVLKRKYGRRMK